MKIKIIVALCLLVNLTGLKAQDDTVSLTYQKPLFDFDEVKPTFKLQNEQLKNKNKFLRFSTLSPYKEGVEPIRGRNGENFKSFQDTVTGNFRNVMYNLSILEMATHGLNRAPVVLEVKDPSKYAYKPSYGSKVEWLRKNGYCYELSLPFGASNGIKTLDRSLANDLNISFGREKRLVKAWVLRKSTLPAQNNNTAPAASVSEINIAVLEERFPEAGLPYLVNETGQYILIIPKLDPGTIKDLLSLNLLLKPYNYEVKEEMRTLTLFILKEVQSK